MKKEPKLLNMSSKYSTLQLHLATLQNARDWNWMLGLSSHFRTRVASGPT